MTPSQEEKGKNRKGRITSWKGSLWESSKAYSGRRIDRVAAKHALSETSAEGEADQTNVKGRSKKYSKGTKGKNKSLRSKRPGGGSIVQMKEEEGSLPLGMGTEKPRRTAAVKKDERGSTPKSNDPPVGSESPGANKSFFVRRCFTSGGQRSQPRRRRK